MSLKKNIQQVFISNFIVILLNTMVYPIILKYYEIGSVEFGIYQKYLSVLLIISSFIFFSMDSAYISENQEHTQEEENSYFSLNILLIFLVTFLSLIILFVLEIEINLFSFSLLCILSNIFQLYIIILKDKRELKISSRILIHQNIINISIILILGYLYRSYIIFIIGGIFSYLYGIIYFQMILKCKLYINLRWIKEFLKRNNEKIFYQLIVNIFQRNSREVPILLFIKYFGEAVVGIYSIANKLLSMGNRILSTALSQSFLAHISKSKNDRDKVIEIFMLLNFSFFEIYLLVSFLSNYYLRYIVGNDYLAVAEIVKQLCPLLFLEAIVNPYTSFFVVENKMKESTIINISSSVFCIAVIWILGRKLEFKSIIYVFVLIGNIRYILLLLQIMKNKEKCKEKLYLIALEIIILFLISEINNIKIFIIIVSIFFILWSKEILRWLLKDYWLYSIKNVVDITKDIDIRNINSISKIRTDIDFREKNSILGMENYLKKGGKCYITYENDKATGHYLVMFNNDRNKYLNLKFNEAYIHYCFVNPNYRNKSIYTTALKKIINDLLKNSEIEKIYIVVEKNNVASVKGIEKAGFIFEKKLKESLKDFLYRIYKRRK